MKRIAAGLQGNVRRVGLIALTLVLAGAGSWRAVRQYPRETIAGETWMQTLACDFRVSWCPAGWGWGVWALEPEGLTGVASTDSIAVYFFGPPARARDGQALEAAGTAAIGNSDVLCEHFRHGEDFAMQAEVRLVRGAGQRPAEAHLLIRGGNAGMHEAGLVLVAERDAAIVRYRAGGVTYVDRFWPLRQPIEYDRWYRLSLSVRDGAVRGEIDGEPVFDSRSDSLPPRLRAWRDSVGAPTPSLPPGVFVEPHLAARSGAAQFRVVQLLVRPDDRWAFVR